MLQQKMKILQKIKKKKEMKKDSTPSKTAVKPVLNIKKRKGLSNRSKKEGTLITTGCEFCNKRFKDAWSVRRHMVGSHGVGVEDLKQYKIKAPQRRCKFCKEMFSNVHKHEKNHCKFMLEAWDNGWKDTLQLTRQRNCTLGN